jgi:hypothetical protein
MAFLYKGFEVDTRLGTTPVIIVRAEAEQGFVQQALKGGSALFIVDKYDVAIYSCEDLNGSSSDLVSLIKSLKGFSKLFHPSESLKLEFEIPVSSKLIDQINEIRRRGRVFALSIFFYWRALLLHTFEVVPSQPLQRLESVEKPSPRGNISPITFFTEEVNELMKELKYAEFIRFDVPVPLIPDAPFEILRKSASELKSVEDAIAKGQYPEALNTLRNIIMNNLTDPLTKEVEEREKDRKKRVLKEEIREYVLKTVSDSSKNIYEEILKGIENTLVSNLAHIHKFIHEETGKLINAPLREDVEYVYFILLSTLRYLSQLILTWGKS